MLKKDLKEKIKSNSKLRIFILLASTVLIALMFPRGESLEFDVAIGSIWIQDDLIASKPFEILKDPEAYRIEKLQAADKVFQIFSIDHTTASTVINSIDKFNNELVQNLDEQLRLNTNFNETFLSPSSFEKLKNIRKYEKSLSVSFTNTIENVFTIIISITSDVYNQNFLDLNYNQIAKDTIALRDGKFENLIPKSRFFDKNTNEERINDLINNYIRNDLSIYPIVKEYLDNFIISTIIYSFEQTKEEIRLAIL